MGLSGVGDTFGTCFGPLSRNRGTGLRLGRGERLDDILADLGEVADRADIDQRHGRFQQNFKPFSYMVSKMRRFRAQPMKNVLSVNTTIVSTTAASPSSFPRKNTRPLHIVKKHTESAPLSSK